MSADFVVQAVLKQDAFGMIEQGLFVTGDDQALGLPAIKRSYSTHPYLKFFAMYLANREKKALKKCNHLSIHTLPKLLYESRHYHIRTYIPGHSMHKVPEKMSGLYFEKSKELLRILRRCGIANNDLAKEANWLVTEEGLPAISDFQLATCFSKNHKLLRILAREDLRHLLKHKKKYWKLTPSEMTLLRKKSFLSNLWRHTGKRLYRFITRNLLGWQDRTGPEERNI